MNEKPRQLSPDSLALIAELDRRAKERHDALMEQTERIAGMSAHAVAATTKVIRIYDASQALDARSLKTQAEAVDNQRRAMADLGRMLSEFRREPSRTIVRSPSIEIEATSDRGDEISVVNFKNPLTGQMYPVPNKYLRQLLIYTLGGVTLEGLHHLISALRNL